VLRGLLATHHEFEALRAHVSIARCARGMPVVRALPTDEFDVHGLNAEMRWEIMRGYGVRCALCELLRAQPNLHAADRRGNLEHARHRHRPARIGDREPCGVVQLPVSQRSRKPRDFSASKCETHEPTAYTAEESKSVSRQRRRAVVEAAFIGLSSARRHRAEPHYRRSQSPAAFGAAHRASRQLPPEDAIVT
jgi:hypothetical protein